MERFLGFIDKLNEWVGRIFSILCLFMVAVIMLEVVLRYVFNNPTRWAHETSAMLFGAYFILTGGYLLRHRGHVNMDIFYNRLSLRGRAILDLCSAPFFFIFCGLILWEGGRMALASLLIFENTTSVWGPPWYPLKLTIPLGALLILLQGLAKFIRDLKVLKVANGGRGEAS